MKLLPLVLLSTLAFAEEPPKTVAVTPQRQTITFSELKASCDLVEGKLVLSKMWPFGSWESCAYSVLQVASQLDAQVNALKAEIQSLKAPKK